MKTKVELKNDDQLHNEYKKGEIGYIDGWVRGADGAPYACVVIGERIVMCKANEIQVLHKKHNAFMFITSLLTKF